VFEGLFSSSQPASHRNGSGGFSLQSCVRARVRVGCSSASTYCCGAACPAAGLGLRTRRGKKNESSVRALADDSLPCTALRTLSLPRAIIPRSDSGAVSRAIFASVGPITRFQCRTAFTRERARITHGPCESNDAAAPESAPWAVEGRA
jgi:hypothetical protein